MTFIEKRLNYTFSSKKNVFEGIDLIPIEVKGTENWLHNLPYLICRKAAPFIPHTVFVIRLLIINSNFRIASKASIAYCCIFVIQKLMVWIFFLADFYPALLLFPFISCNTDRLTDTPTDRQTDRHTDLYSMIYKLDCQEAAQLRRIAVFVIQLLFFVVKKYIIPNCRNVLFAYCFVTVTQEILW